MTDTGQGQADRAVSRSLEERSDSVQGIPLVTAGRAQAVDLDGLRVDLEAEIPGLVRQHLMDVGIIHFGHRIAVLTDQELSDMRSIGVTASHVGVQGLDPVDQAFLEKKIQGAIHRGWRGAPPFGAQHVQEIVGLHGLVPVPDEFQHPPPDRRQPDAASLALTLCTRKGVVHAMIVIMVFVLERCYHCRAHRARSILLKQ